MSKRGMTTRVARALGYVSPLKPSREDKITQMPMVSEIRSYHQYGMSSKEMYLKERSYRETLELEFKL